MNTPTSQDYQRLAQMPLTPLAISGVDMLLILAQIQLVLRHPGNTGPGSKVARVLAEELEKRIVEASPAFRELCAAGWDPDRDVEPLGPSASRWRKE